MNFYIDYSLKCLYFWAGGMWTIFKGFVEFTTILLLLFMFCFFWGHKACGILTPQPGVDLQSPTLEGDVSTSGPLGKS